MDRVTDVPVVLYLGYSESVTCIFIFYHSVQNLPSSSLLPRNIKTKLCKTTSLSVVLYGCGIWSLTLREERRLRVCENRALRRIFGPKKDNR